MLQPKVTLRDTEIDTSGFVMDVCCEPDCNIPVMVEKEMKEHKRQFRCTSCLMRFKMRPNKK